MSGEPAEVADRGEAAAANAAPIEPAVIKSKKGGKKRKLYVADDYDDFLDISQHSEKEEERKFIEKYRRKSCFKVRTEQVALRQEQQQQQQCAGDSVKIDESLLQDLNDLDLDDDDDENDPDYSPDTSDDSE